MLDIDLATETESAKRFLRVIDRHSARLEALVADLLALSRLESAARDFKPTPLDVRVFFNELHARWAEIAAEKRLHWECVVRSNVHLVTVDPQLTGLALDNLVDNAIKFTAPGGQVAITCARDQSNLIIEVADDGCGIPADDQERVFERFYQVARDRSGTGSVQPEARGTGLGLSIVRHAVAAMKGAVVLKSEVGVGTRVTLTITQPVTA